MVKNPPANAGNARDTDSVPGSGRSPGEGNGNSLQYYYLENPMDRGVWWATVHEVAKSQARLSTHTQTHKKHTVISLLCVQNKKALLFLKRGKIATKYFLQIQVLIGLPHFPSGVT